MAPLAPGVGRGEP